MKHVRVLTKERKNITRREKCPYSEFFWPAFSRIRIEYGEILRISPYSVWMRENTDQKNSEYGHFSFIVTWQDLNPLSINRTEWQNKLKWSTNWLSMFDHLVGLAVKGLRIVYDNKYTSCQEFLTIDNLLRDVVMTNNSQLCRTNN